MSAKRMFILWRHPLFYDSLRLLLADPELVLVGSGPAERTPVEAVAAAEPDVVIVEKADDDDPETADEFPGLEGSAKVVYLGLADNELSVVQRRKLMLTSVDELRALLLEEPDSGPAGSRRR